MSTESTPPAASARHNAVWTVAGFGAMQVIRFGSTLILSRLLFPDIFGLMALVNVFLQGLQMFTDVGIGPSIIQNKRGDEPDFRDTAWTILVLRGLLLWFCSVLIAIPVWLLLPRRQAHRCWCLSRPLASRLCSTVSNPRRPSHSAAVWCGRRW